MAVNLQAYFNELSNLKTWTYPDKSSSYTITTTDTAAADNTPGRQTYSGWLMATSAYSSSSLVSGLNSHLPIMELRLCVGLGNTNSQLRQSRQQQWRLHHRLFQHQPADQPARLGPHGGCSHRFLNLLG